jgi:hypothetical protein
MNEFFIAMAVCAGFAAGAMACARYPVLRGGRPMTEARILALGGTLASALTMFGGLLGWTTMVGMAGAVMLTANVVVLAGVGRQSR